MSKLDLILYLKRQGFSEKVLRAFEKVKREDFISDVYRNEVYENIPLPLVGGATISQPYTIAFMLDLLELKEGGREKVLEIGSGSGYVLALTYEITKGETYGVEIVKELVMSSKKQLKDIKNINIFHGNGIIGLEERAPYDKILISAACPDMDTVKGLMSQLNKTGVLVASVNNSIIKIKNENGKEKIVEYPGFSFVRLRN
jgi:protein-L-isoaspartate(D-aspartate) O-methyltransferase